MKCCCRFIIGSVADEASTSAFEQHSLATDLINDVKQQLLGEVSQSRVITAAACSSETAVAE